jgi:hypothetical protein
MFLLLKKLTTVAELECFAATQILNQGTATPLDYLRQASVYVVYRPTAPDIWMGGFVVSTDYKRYFEVLTPEQSQKIDAEQIAFNQTAEITCIWKNRSSAMPVSEVAHLYFYALREGFRTKKRFIVAGTANEKIRRIQMIVFRRLLFSGSVNFYGDSHHVWIYYCKRWELFPGFLRYINTFLW